MTKSELISAAAETAGVTKKDAEAVLKAVLGSIEQALADGETVQLIGFGSFEVRERSARVARNPRTGEKTNVPACKVPAFKPSKTLKEIVNK